MSLEVDGLSVYYRSLAGDVRAVDDVSFQLADGEIMGLAGESGCGKSSLGKSLTRLDTRMRYVSGSVRLDGEELPIWDDERMNAFRFRRVSLVPQYAMSALNPTRKIGRMVHDLLRSRGVDFHAVRPELRRRFDLVGLSENLLSRYPIELSGGQKQRVVMVVSTLLDPSLLVADEITSALDVASQKAVAEMLVEFRDRGYVKSVIVITHDLAILHQLADTILVMYAGRFAEKASADQIANSPHHPYAQALVGSLPAVGVRYAERRLAGIRGRPPSLLDPPAGCRFRDRCALAFERCEEQPPWTTEPDGRGVACWAVQRSAALAAPPAPVETR